MEIKLVTLLTKDMEKLKRFYVDFLGFELVEERGEGFRLKVGKSELEFMQADKGDDPFYHFAFNIPFHLFTDAKKWARERMVLNTEEGEDEIEFPQLSARSFYFWDPAGNMVEFIARKNVCYLEEKAFSAGCLKDISEVSLTVANVLEAMGELERSGLKSRDNEPIQRTCLNFLGDNGTHSYLLLVERGRRWIFSDQVSEIYPLEVYVDGKGSLTVDKQGRCSVISF
ncbi:VOC family protein [Halobacillus dabanensis]|nr:VOC family protein [Halobacillus dabanensis]